MATTNEPQPGDVVIYHTDSDTVARGFLAERVISPLTLNPRYRVVDSMQEAKDEDAGKWMGMDRVIRFDE